MINTTQKKRIIIVGGGFGGVKVCQILGAKLPKDKFEIFLVDKNQGQTFLPLLYEIGALYGVEHDHPFHKMIKSLLVFDYSILFNGLNISVIQAEVGSLHLKDKRIQIQSGEYLDFDYCVLAVGSVYDDLGIPGVEEYAFPFKTIDHAVAVNDKIEDLIVSHKLLYHAKNEHSVYSEHKPLVLSIIGGGPNGIELAGELSSFAGHFGHRHDFKLEECFKLRIFEAKRIMPNSHKIRNLALRRLAKLKVEVIEGCLISQVNSSSIALKNGLEYNSDMIIWTAGVKAPRLIEKSHGIELSDKKRIIVNNDNMLLTGFDNIFAIGDCVDYIDSKGISSPLIAISAINQGRVVSNYILKDLNFPIYSIFLTSKYPFIMPIGGRYAILSMGKLVLHGWLAFIAREVVHIHYFVSVFPFYVALKKFFYLSRIFKRNN